MTEQGYLTMEVKIKAPDPRLKCDPRDVFRALGLTPEQRNRSWVILKKVLGDLDGSVPAALLAAKEQITNPVELMAFAYVLGFSTVKSHYDQQIPDLLGQAMEAGADLAAGRIPGAEPDDPASDGAPAPASPPTQRPAPEPDISVQGMYE